MSDSYDERLEDFNWALGLNRLSLRLMGVWPEDETDVPGFRHTGAHLRVPFMILAVIFCIFLPQMWALTLVIHDLPLVLDNLLTSSTALTCCIKLFFIWRSKQVLRPVIQSVAHDWLRPDKCAWELRAMRREASRARLFTAIAYATMAVCYVAFAFTPVFGATIRELSNITDYGERPLIVQAYYPYDYSTSPNYELSQATILLAEFVIMLALTVAECYFAVLVFHCSAQFEILGTNIESCIRESDRCPWDWKFNVKLRAFVDRHVHLMA